MRTINILLVVMFISFSFLPLMPHVAHGQSGGVKEGVQDFIKGQLPGQVSERTESDIETVISYVNFVMIIIIAGGLLYSIARFVIPPHQARYLKGIGYCVLGGVLYFSIMSLFYLMIDFSV